MKNEKTFLIDVVEINIDVLNFEDARLILNEEILFISVLFLQIEKKRPEFSIIDFDE
jgi:hypothetical protein